MAAGIAGCAEVAARRPRPSAQARSLRCLRAHDWSTRTGSAEPPTLHSAVPNCRPGDTIPFGYKTPHVVDVRDDEADQAPVLVVEDVAG
jgi:hypothetical protein